MPCPMPRSLVLLPWLLRLLVACSGGGSETAPVDAGPPDIVDTRADAGVVSGWDIVAPPDTVAPDLQARTDVQLTEEEPCDRSAGWCSVGPWAPATHHWAIVALAGDDVWLGGSGNAIQHWDGQDLRNVSYPSDRSDYFTGAWASGPSDVWLTGIGVDAALALHWDGRAWQRHEIPGDAWLNRVWGAASDDVWMVDSKQGRIYHWNGRSWAVDAPAVELGIPGDVMLYDVWGTGADDVWAVGGQSTNSGHNRCVLLHWYGNGWTDRTPTRLDSTHGSPVDCTAVWGTASDNVRVAGYDYSHLESLLLHWDGEAWSVVDVVFPTSFVETVTGTGPDDLWVLGREDLFHWDGQSWHSVRPEGATNPKNLTIAPEGDVFLTADWGVLYQRDGEEWAERSLPRADLRAGAIDDESLWVVGSYGAAYRREGDAWLREELGTRATLTNVWLDPAGQPWITSNEGLVYHRGDAGWQVRETGSELSLNAIWGRSAEDLWVVGGSTDEPGSSDEDAVGVVLHWDGSAWTEIPAPEGGALFAVAGTADGTLWVGGDFTAPLQREGESWVSAPAPFPSEVRWQGVFDLSFDASGRLWASGYFRRSEAPVGTGYLAHYAEGRWTLTETERANEVAGVWSDGASLTIGAGEGIEVWVDEGQGLVYDEPGTGAINDVVGTPDGRVLFIGAGGQVYERHFGAGD